MSNSARADRKLTAILAADVAGYSRLINQDELGTLERLAAYRQIFDSLIASHGGRIANTAGDSVLAEFGSVVDAVQCALAVQAKRAEMNADAEPKRQLCFRIGIHIGDVLVKGGDLLGEGVNIAARIEGLAEPGGILLSDDAHAQVRKLLPLTFADLGEQALKNISEPMRVFAVLPERAEGAAASSVAGHGHGVASSRPALAVMAFETIGTEGDAALADGIVEDIITMLSRIRWLHVIDRHTSYAYRDRHTDSRQIGRALGVRYILGGSIRQSAGRVRISVQLVEAETGRHLWAERFDETIDHIFELQDRISYNVAGAAEPSLRIAETERAGAKADSELDAYDLHLRALAPMAAYTPKSSRQAEALLRRSITIAPTYADALSTLAECLGQITLNGWSEDFFGSFEETVELARRAMTADPENAMAVAVCAWTYAIFGRQTSAEVGYGRALELAERAVQLNPNAAQVRAHVGWVYTYYGEIDRALEHFNAARRLNPIDPRGYFPMLGIAVSHFFAKRFDEAAMYARRILHDVPSHNIARRFLIAALTHLGQNEEARAQMRDLLQIWQPNANLLRARNNSFRFNWMLELYVSGLQGAGLPD